jgi:hypothetical protein
MRKLYNFLLMVDITSKSHREPCEIILIDRDELDMDMT